MLEKIKNFSWGYVLVGALLLAIGICFVCFNDAFNVLAIVMGAILTAAGIGFLIAALVDKRRGVLFAVKTVLSASMIVCGIITMITQSSAVAVIANVFFLLLIVDGAFKLQLAILSRRFSFFGWWVMVGFAVVVIVCAFLLAKLTPEDSTRLSVLSGLLIAFDGVGNILAAFWHSALNTRVEADRAPKSSDATAETAVVEE